MRLKKLIRKKIGYCRLCGGLFHTHIQEYHSMYRKWKDEMRPIQDIVKGQYAAMEWHIQEINKLTKKLLRS